jgi:hypothetical protein
MSAQCSCYSTTAAFVSFNASFLNSLSISPSSGRILSHHLFQHDAHVIAENAKDTVQMHAVLVLLEVVSDHGESPCSQKIFVH